MVVTGKKREEELRRLWRRALNIWYSRSRRSRLQDMRMESRHEYPPTSIEGLLRWIRRRGVGVDILGLDAGVPPVKRVRLAGRRTRPRGPWMNVLAAADYRRLFSVNDDLSLAEKYYEDVLGEAYRLASSYSGDTGGVSKSDLLDRFSKNIGWAEIEKRGWIDDWGTFKDLMFTAGFKYDRTFGVNLFEPEYFLRRPRKALEALREIHEKYGSRVRVRVKPQGVLAHELGIRTVSMGLDEFADLLVDKVFGRRDMETYMSMRARPVMTVYSGDPNYYALREDVLPDELLEKLRNEILSYKYRSYDRDLHEVVERVRKVYREKWIDGAPYLLVPRGMAYTVYRFLRDNGVEVELQPYAPWIAENLRDKPLGGVVKTLRPYQLEAEAKMLEFLSMIGGATLWAATGAGKTEVVIDLISRLLPLLEKGYLGGRRKVYFLATTKDLVYQFAERCRKYGIQVGVVTGEEFDLDKPVVAVTVQSLYKALQKYKELSEEEKRELRGLSDKPEEGVRLDEVPLKEQQKRLLAHDYVDNAGLVVFDEVQHVPAKTIRYTVLANKEALRIGLSATPWRDDDHDMLIYASIGSIVDRKITSSELIARGFLVPPFIVMVRYSDPVLREADERLAWKRGNRYNEVLKIVYGDRLRNEYIADVAKHLVDKGYGPVLVLVERVPHGKALNKVMVEKGLRSVFIHGSLSGKRRKQILEDARKGRLDVLIGTTVADEGLDIPNLRSLMIVRAGKSRVKAFQRIGRVIRRYPGKDRAIVVDLWDDILYLRDHGERRYEMYRSEPLWFVRVAPSKDEAFRLIDEDISLPHNRLEDMVRAKYREVVEESYK